MTTEQHNKKRHFMVRICAFVAWLIALVLLTNIVTGQLVIHGAGTDLSTAQGLADTNLAQMHFMARYGVFLMFGPVMATVVLAYCGVLPATGQYKKQKQHNGERQV